MKAGTERKSLEQHWADLERFKSRSKKKGSEFNAEYEHKLGEIVLEEFRQIWESRGGGEEVSLPEAVSLFIAVMWKNNYANLWYHSAHMLRLFYEETVVKSYQAKNFLRSDFDRATMNILIEDSQNTEKHNASCGIGFLTLFNIAGRMRHIQNIRRGDSNDLIEHYLSVRMMEQMLDYAKYWFEKELSKEKPFDLQMTDISNSKGEEELERKRKMRIEGAKLMIKEIDSLFEKEQVPFWQKHQQEYLEIWKPEHRTETHIWKRDFNIFKKYWLGEELPKDVEMTYFGNFFESIYHEDRSVPERHQWKRGDKETLKKGTVVTFAVFEKLIYGHICSDKELESLVQWRNGHLSGNEASNLRSSAACIEFLTGTFNPVLVKRALANGWFDNERNGILNMISIRLVKEYLRLVREDGQLNRISWLSVGEVGDEQGRPIGGDPAGIDLILNIPGGGYLSDIYNGVKDRLSRKKPVVASADSGVKIEELEDTLNEKSKPEENYSVARTSSKSSTNSSPDINGNESLGSEESVTKNTNYWLPSLWSWFSSSKKRDEAAQSFQKVPEVPPPSIETKTPSLQKEIPQTETLEKEIIEETISSSSKKQQQPLANSVKGKSKTPPAPKSAHHPEEIGKEQTLKTPQPQDSPKKDSQNSSSKQANISLNGQNKPLQTSSQTEKNIKKTSNTKDHLFFNKKSFIGILGFLITILCAYYFRKFGLPKIDKEKLAKVASNIKPLSYLSPIYSKIFGTHQR